MEETPENRRNKQPINFDTVLLDIGEFGKFQKILYFTVCSTIIFTTGCGLSVVFAGALPNRRCFIENCDTPKNAKYSDAFTKGFGSFSIPPGSQSICHQYGINESETKASCTRDTFAEKVVEKCKHGVVIDHTYYGSTIVEDYDLACNEEWKVPLVESFGFVGIMIAALSCGILADKYGRKHIMMSCLALVFVSSMFECFSTSFWMYLFFQTLTNLGQAGFFQTGFILSLELVGQSHRVFCGIVIEFFFVIGEVLLTFVAWGVRSWRWIMAVIFIPVILPLLAWSRCPESVRWLLVG